MNFGGSCGNTELGAISMQQLGRMENSYHGRIEALTALILVELSVLLVVDTMKDAAHCSFVEFGVVDVNSDGFKVEVKNWC